MPKKILFIHGGGDDGYEADQMLRNSLQKELAKAFDIHFPQMKSDEAAADFGWMKQIGEEISQLSDGDILAGHSLGASFLLKWLSENTVPIEPAGIFLLATPYWNGKEQWQKGLKLQVDFADKLPNRIPFFFYHSKDDEVISPDQFEFYRKNLPHAIFRELEKGGHQFNNDLGFLAEDIKAL